MCRVNGVQVRGSGMMDVLKAPSEEQLTAEALMHANLMRVRWLGVFLPSSGQVSARAKLTGAHAHLFSEIQSYCWNRQGAQHL